MAITIQDVQDLIKLLRERPEWRAEMERALLGDELLSLPQIVRELAEAQKRTEARLETLAQRVEELAEAQKRTEARLETLTQRVEELAEAQKRTEARIEELAEAQKRTEARIDALTQRVEAQIAALVERMDKFEAAQERMEIRLGRLSGMALELSFERRAPSYLSELALKVRVIPHQDFVAAAQDAVDQGTLTNAEASSIGRLDLLARGVRRQDRTQIYLAVEISETIRSKDVSRAARRAELLRRIYPQVIPVVAGEDVSPAAKEEAEQNGVTIVLDGKTLEDKD